MIRFFLFLFLSLAALASGQTTTSITQFGITWTFSTAREYGQFANGDYWVQGPVTIDSMTPDWTGVTNGWMVDPLPAPVGGWTQAYHSDAAYYNAAGRPSLPLTLSQGSVVKVIGVTRPLPTNDKYQNTKTAAVLTVLPSIPSGRGVGFFRPPYVGSAKPLNAVADVRGDLLPSFAMTAGARTLQSISDEFDGCLRLEYSNLRNRMLRPKDVMDDYGADQSPPNNTAILRFLGPETWAEKLPAATYYLQYAIDKAYAVTLNYRGGTGDGHDPTHRLIAAFGATMMDLTTIITYMSTATYFHEDRFIQPGVNGPVWGDGSTTEYQYWYHIALNGPSTGQSSKDPYGFIDGGWPPNASAGAHTGPAYLWITGHGLKGQALNFRLFPLLQNCFPSAHRLRFDAFVQRWVDVGLWMSPDPVAPVTTSGSMTGYGSTFGPNGSGSYIAGAGRYPALHGTLANTGQRNNAFVNSMWVEYNGQGADTTAPTLLSASIDGPGLNLILVFSEQMQGISAAHYSISSGNTLGTPTGGAETWAMSLSPAVQNGAVPTLAYTSGASRTADIAGNLLATFSGRLIDNDSYEDTPDPPKTGRKGIGGARSPGR